MINFNFRKKLNPSDIEAPCLDLNLSTPNGIITSKLYAKRDDVDFDILGPVVQSIVS